MSKTPSRHSGLFSFKAALLAVVIGAVSFAALVVLTAFAPELEDKDQAGLHAYSKSALGYNLAVELLRRSGHAPEISRNSALLANGDAFGVLVLTPAGARDLEDLKAVEFDRYDPTLIILPKRWGMPDFNRPTRYRRVGELDLNDVSSLLQPFADSFGLRRTNPASELVWGGNTFPATFTDRTQVISSGPIDPILTSSEGTLFGRIEGTNTYIVSDPELLNTHGLKSIENARLMLRIFDQVSGYDVQRPIVFDTTLHGFERNKSLLRALFEPPMLGATLFAFAAAILLGWAAFVRVGKAPSPLPPFATGRASLIDSTAGLFSQTRREATLAAGYGELSRRLALLQLGHNDDLSMAQAEALLKSREERLNQDGVNMTERPKDDDVKTAHQLVHYAQNYYRWKKDVSDGRN